MPPPSFTTPPKLLTLPAFPISQPNFIGTPGPYEWSGNLYWVTIEVDASGIPSAVAYKSTDQAQSQPMTRIASGQTVSTSTGIGVSYPGSGSLIYFAYMDRSTNSQHGKLFINTFDMATDSFGTPNDTGINITSGATVNNIIGYKLSSGNLVVLWDRQISIGSVNAIVYSGSWSSTVVISASGSELDATLIDGAGNVGIFWDDGTSIKYTILTGTSPSSPVTVAGITELSGNSRPYLAIYDSSSDSVAFATLKASGSTSFLDLLVGTPSAAPAFSTINVGSATPGDKFEWAQAVIIKIGATFYILVWDADLNIVPIFLSTSLTSGWTGPTTYYNQSTDEPNPMPAAPETYPIYATALSSGRLATTIGFLYNIPTHGNFCGVLAALVPAPPTASATLGFTVHVAAPSAVVMITLACPASGGTATIGSSYSKTLVESGGTGPFTYAIVAGSLPLGLTLNASTGNISGTPTLPTGTFTYTAQVTDSLGATAQTSCTIVLRTSAGGCIQHSLI